MNVDLKILKLAIVKAIEDYAFLQECELIHLDKKFYWTLLDDDIFDLSTKPENLGVGDLEEEYSNLLRLIHDDELISAVDLQQLAGILTWLSVKAGAAPDAS